MADPSRPVDREPSTVSAGGDASAPAEPVVPPGRFEAAVASRSDWIPSGETLVRWHVPSVAGGLGLASVAVMAAATATKNHNFWIFAGWVVLTVAAIVAGVAVLMSVPRARPNMGVRRAACFGVVMAVLCATLGLAVYSQTREHDCPATGPCNAATPGPGQRPQLP